MFLVGCRGNVNTTPTGLPLTVTHTPMPATSTPLPTATPTIFPSPSPTIPPTPVAQLKDIEKVFMYMPRILIMSQSQSIFWNTTYYVDIAQIRQTLDSPAVLETSQQKRNFILELAKNTQGVLSQMPFYEEMTYSKSEEQWGWDLTYVTFGASS